METTVYMSYLKKGTILNRRQMHAVGLSARNLYMQIFGQLPAMIKQQALLLLIYTGKNHKLIKFQVFVYAPEFEPIIFNLLDEQIKKQARQAIPESV